VIDIALDWNAAQAIADLAILQNDLKPEEGLRSAVLLSLFSNRYDPETDAGGWWGDLVPVVAGDLMGSRLWLLARAKRTPEVLELAKNAAQEALQWLVDDLVASSVDVVAEFFTAQGLGLTVTISRPNDSPVRFRFGSAWAAEETRI
jgi:phage gp46-like protein